MQCTTLEPNGKFSVNSFWLDMGLTNSEKESKLFSGTRSVFTKSLAIYDFIYRCSTLHSLQVKKKKQQQQQQTEIWLILVSQELLERRVVVHFTLYYSRERFFTKGFVPEIPAGILFSCVCFLTGSVLLVCTHAHRMK